MENLPTLLTPQQTADALHKSIHTLKFWRLNDKGPAFVRIGRTPWYDEDVVRAYMKGEQQPPES